MLSRQSEQVFAVKTCRGEILLVRGCRIKKDLLDLIRCLVDTNIIPEALVNNSTLQSIWLTQIMLETLNGISVPKAPQGNNFTYHMNAKEMMMWELGAKNAKHIKSLEDQTGVNLHHYYKLKIDQQ